MSSRQQLGCITAVADLAVWAWSALRTIAEEVFGAVIDKWRSRRR